MSASYLALRPIYVGGIYYSPADTVTMPDSWRPPAAVDPLNTEAVQSFYNAGPQFLDSIIGSYVGNFQSVPFGTVEIKPVTYWTPVFVSPFSSAFSPAFGPLTTNGQWVLTGLGSNQSLYPPIGI